MSIGERIKEVRKTAGLSQTAFGEKICISRSSINKIESGENNPSSQTVSMIAKEFNVNLRWLETGEGEMTSGAANTNLVRELRDILGDEDPLLVANIAAIFAMPKEYRDVFAAKVREIYNQFK